MPERNLWLRLALQKGQVNSDLLPGGLLAQRKRPEKGVGFKAILEAPYLPDTMYLDNNSYFEFRLVQP